MDRTKKRILVALLIVAPAALIATIFLFAPKADTPRDEALPDGNLTAVAFGVVEAGSPDHPASGNVTLYRNETGGHFLFFRGYEARSGPNVWFHLVGPPAAASEQEVEDNGVQLHVPGPGHATYRGTFLVPIPADADVAGYGAVVAWDRTLDERFAVAALQPA